MTDKNDLLLRPTAPQTSTAHDSWSVSKPLVKSEPTEDEDYTIKCICGVPDDDGNTVFCDYCDTWQHIGCYYPDLIQEIGENFSHLCVDCKPRPLNRERAVERMRKFSCGALEDEEEEEAERREKKTKRRMSKSSKKKPKPSDLHFGTASGSHKVSRSEHGHTHTHNHSHSHSQGHSHSHAHDSHHQHKKSKSAHKISYSASSHSGKRSPSYGKPPSPASTPPDVPIEFDTHKSSPTLISPYDVTSVEIVDTNTFASIEVLNTISMWARDPKRLALDTKQQFRDVFQPMRGDEISRCKDIYIGHMKCSGTGAGPDMRVQYLATRAPIPKETAIVEINGNVGFQNTYCAIPENNWSDFITPLPFVFFHPRLPLYIDTRREGSDARYVRRSCKPNATLETFLSGSEYRFWLVSDRYVGADEQITLPWDFRIPPEQKARVMTLLGLNTDDYVRQPEPDMDHEEFELHSKWLDRVLALYGGCACDLGDNCAFKRFHRSFVKSQSRALAAQKKKASRKAKPPAVSPTSTAPQSDSRAPSEMRLDDSGELDVRTTPDVKSKAPSRERSPPRLSAFDQPGILTEPTDRDKRKVAMVEDTFRRMEQQQQPPRKKKRVLSDGGQAGIVSAANDLPNNSSVNGSSGSGSGFSTSANTNANGSNTNASNSTASKPSKTRGDKAVSTYADAGTMGGKSPSPASTAFTAPPRRSASRQNSTVPRSRQASVAPSLLNQARSSSTYTNSSTQTEPNEDGLFVPPPAPMRPGRRVISLARRLMDARKLRLEELARHAATCAATATDSATIVATTTATTITTTTDTAAPTVITGADSIRPKRPFEDLSGSTEDRPMPHASEPAAHDTSKKSDVRVHFPPALTSTPGAGSSSTAVPAAVISPFSCSLQNTLGLAAATVTPGPVKKKLSLSDYTKSRANKSAATAKALSSAKLATAEETAGTDGEGVHEEGVSGVASASTPV
ncbi:hypothetical protein TD95_002743 [Thielaviopsis punctulata]|uniref:SET domain-containing protein n=1 Tax=Thielaviopsis punctulata TaxID=72032 RepID=A0A0F4ZL40_9PEZI|nr:hypothetical protein TD95_002743 [Thielaviopsis punctulata]